MNDARDYAFVHITRGHFYCARHKGEVGEFRAYFDGRGIICKACRKQEARAQWWAKLREARRDG